MESVNVANVMEPIANAETARAVAEETTELAANTMARFVTAANQASEARKLTPYFRECFVTADASAERARTVQFDGLVKFFEAIAAEIAARGAETQTVGEEKVDDTTASDAIKSIVEEVVSECIIGAKIIRTARAASDEVAIARSLAKKVDDAEIANEATKSIVREGISEYIKDISLHVESIKITKTATGEEATDVSTAREIVHEAVKVAEALGGNALVSAACKINALKKYQEKLAAN